MFEPVRQNNTTQRDASSNSDNAREYNASPFFAADLDRLVFYQYILAHNSLFCF